VWIADLRQSGANGQVAPEAAGSDPQKWSWGSPRDDQERAGRRTPVYDAVGVAREIAMRTKADRVKRRLAAILAADVAGYSRLMSEDEEGTHERLKAHLSELVAPTVEEHRGRIVKNTGDGVLVECSSVVDALRCAVEVQRGMADRNKETPDDKRIAFRIGINIGDLIVEPDDIYGDGVNVAARLEGIAEPGGICMSDDAFRQVRGKTNTEFSDIGERHLKNIGRPVRIYRAVVDSATVVAVRPALQVPDKPSVAVLPFATTGGNPEQEAFADGIADDVITALSRYPSLFVISRNSCFTYKGRAVDVKQVGRELGVRYVLEGSLRKSGNRIRVNAQLVEAEIGNHVWAERYDRGLADIFALQDEITEAVTIAITPAIAEAERQRAIRKPPGALDTWAAYQRGLWHLVKYTAEDNALAQRFFQSAIDLDPAFTGGYKGLCIAKNQAAADFGIHDLSTIWTAEGLARRAVALDSGDAEAHAILSNSLRLRGDYDGALAEAERALVIAPNLARAHGAKGITLIFSGRPRDGLVSLDTCIRLDPRDPTMAARMSQKTLALYFCREYLSAINVARETIRFYPKHPVIYRWLAASLGQLGRVSEAKTALRRAIAIAPSSFEMYVRGPPPWHRLEDHAHLLEGLRKAGWEG
jgi:adenylate cyclase